MSFYGYRPSSGSRVGFGQTGTTTDNERAYFPHIPMSGNGWLMAIGGRLGRQVSSGNPSVELGAWRKNTSGHPSTLIGETASFTVATAMDSNVTGADYLEPVLQTYKLQDGQYYAIGSVNRTAPLMHGMIAAALAIAAGYGGDQTFYRGDAGSLVVADPNDYNNPTYEGKMELYLEYEPNVAPSAPGSLSPANAAVLTSLIPTFSGSFIDGNSSLSYSLSGDTLKQTRIVVTRVSDGVVMWDQVMDSDSSERGAAAFTRAYGGAALAAGPTYSWQAQTRDQFDEWSPLTAVRTFTISLAGGQTVNVNSSTPSGKQETVQPGPFLGSYTHPSGLSTNAADVRIKTASGVVNRSMATPWYATVVPSGSTISVPWASTGFADIPKGAIRSWSMRARDSANVWGDWSDDRPFTIDAVPGIPTNLSPSGSAVQYAPWIISCKVVDDDDTVGTGLVVKARIKFNDVVLSAPRSMALRAGTTDTFDYQLVAGTNELKRITRGGTISGGSFTLTPPATWLGASAPTAAIQWNDTAATIKTKLEALACIGVGNVDVTGGPVSTTNLDITFKNQLGGTDLGTMTVADSTTGAGHSLAVSTVTEGVLGDLTSGYGTYKFDCYSGDGTFWSGGSTVEASAVKSAEAVVVYSAGVVVTITAPTAAQVLTSNTPTATWTATVAGVPITQVSFNVKAWTATLGGSKIALVLDETVISAIQSYTFAPGILLNTTSYAFEVTATNATPTTGTSSTRFFSLLYADALTPANFRVLPYALRGDPLGEESAVFMSWDASTETDFDRYAVFAVPTDRSAPTRRIANFFDVDTTSFIYGLPMSGKAYNYSIRQYVKKAGGELVSSAPAVVELQITFGSSIICDARDAENRRAVLPYRKARSMPRSRNQNKVQPWTQTEPTILRDNSHGKSIVTTYDLPIANMLEAVEELIASIDDLDQFGGPLCYRDGRGRRDFGEITEFSENDPAGGGVRQITIGFEKTSYVEGPVSE